MIGSCPRAHQVDALSIISNPKPEYSPGLRLLAWAVLKGARGQAVHQHRLGRARSAGSVAS